MGLVNVGGEITRNPLIVNSIDNYREGHEVDVVVDEEGLRLPVEIKSGATSSSDWYNNIRYFAALQAPDPPRSYLIYGGPDGLKRQETQVLSWTDLEPLTTIL